MHVIDPYMPPGRRTFGEVVVARVPVEDSVLDERQLQGGAFGDILKFGRSLFVPRPLSASVS